MEHVKYLQPWGRGTAVLVECTCGQSHGLESYRSLAQAMETGRFDMYVKYWVNNSRVSHVSQAYAEAGTGIEAIREVLSFKI